MASWLEEEGGVVSNQQVDQDVYLMRVASPEVCAAAVPGQFVMLVAWEGEPLLPRAMAPIRFGSDGIMDVFYRVVGRGTLRMAQAVAGQPVTVIGPLGTPMIPQEGPVALIGRGVGITPLLPIAEAAKGRGLEVRSYLSARSQLLLLDPAAFLRTGPVTGYTDDEVPGQVVTDRLAADLAGGFRPKAAVVAGSHRLARAVRTLSEAYGVAAYVFVEEKMACGVGFCKGCAIGPHRDLICTAGPGLPIQEVLP